ncbi:hypothetical protein BpHYR1_015416 [Brachionus plicatilis]|uniref:Uncharacterized protein n=1 Tax=Brachionus plicatilis TaxID=10195 RepID=A0A3M7R2D1_BRAPC|nr:hypothetical protein BpHYR1_015416 [Brachionus plicatilis]
MDLVNENKKGQIKTTISHHERCLSLALRPKWPLRRVKQYTLRIMLDVADKFSTMFANNVRGYFQNKKKDYITSIN